MLIQGKPQIFLVIVSITTAYTQLRLRNPHITDNFLVKWTVNSLKLSEMLYLALKIVS